MGESSCFNMLLDAAVGYGAGVVERVDKPEMDSTLGCEGVELDDL